MDKDNNRSSKGNPRLTKLKIEHAEPKVMHPAPPDPTFKLA